MPEARAFPRAGCGKSARPVRRGGGFTAALLYQIPNKRWPQPHATRTEAVGFDLYHEPPAGLSQESRTFARMVVSIADEAEAINWFEQCISVEQNKDAKAIMQNAQREEMKHFGMDLEFLLRQKPKWKELLQGILFQPGNIVKHGEEAEEDAQ